MIRLAGDLARTMGERTRRVALAALAGLAQRAITITGTFLMYPLVLQTIGQANFGIWGAATSLILLISIADFGIGPALMTLAPRALARGDKDLARDYFSAGFAMAGAVGLSIAAAGFAAVVGLVPAEEREPYLIAVAGVALNVPLGIANPMWMALQRGWQVGFWDAVQTVLLVAGLLAAIATTRDLNVYVAVAYGALLVSNALNLAWLLFSRPDMRPRQLDTLARTLRAMVSTGSTFFLLTTFDALSYMLDNVIALQLLGADASARMTIVQRIGVASMGLLVVISQPLWPAFVDAAARGDRRWLFRALFRGSALVTAAAVAGSALIVAFGGQFLRLWLKHDIGVGQSLLWITAVWIVSLSLVRVQILLLNALNIVRFQILVFTVATAAALVLKVVLGRAYGVAGILAATAVTFPLIVLPAVVWRTARWRSNLPPASISSETSLPV